MIAYRQMREQLVERTQEFAMQTRIGPAKAIAYKTRFEDAEHIALLFGDPQANNSVPVRIHRERLLEDVFGSQSTQHERNLLEVALDRIEALGSGVLIYLRSGHVGVPSAQLIDASREDTRHKQWLEIGVGAQILRDLGLTHIRPIAGREVDYVAVEGFGLRLDKTELLSGLSAEWLSG